jgi:hypothetical protein
MDVTAVREAARRQYSLIVTIILMTLAGIIHTGDEKPARIDA